jgi:hypothetical protein
MRLEQIRHPPRGGGSRASALLRSPKCRVVQKRGNHSGEPEGGFVGRQFAGINFVYEDRFIKSRGLGSPVTDCISRWLLWKFRSERPRQTSTFVPCWLLIHNL